MQQFTALSRFADLFNSVQMVLYSKGFDSLFFSVLFGRDLNDMSFTVCSLVPILGPVL